MTVLGGGRVDVLGAYWTTAGPVRIRAGREWSLFDWRARCEEAGRTGMRGLGLWHADLEHLLHTHSLRELGTIFTESGLEHLELEFLDDWFVDAADTRRAGFEARRELLFSAAAVLPVHHIKVGNLTGARAGLDQLTEGFARLCADAADRHDATMTYELMPFDVNAPALEAVLSVVRGSGAANGAIALDTWHLGKMAITPKDLRALPPELLGYVELSDGAAEDMPDLDEETTRFRRLPGEGDFDLVGYVRELAGLGYRGPWGVEVLSDALRALPMDEMFSSAYRATVAQFG